MKKNIKLQEIYEWGTFEQSLIISSFFWGYVVLMIPVGYLANVWSAQKLLSMSLLLSGLVHALTPIFVYYGDWQAMCATRVAIGFFQTCFMASIHTLISKWAPPTERSFISKDIIKYMFSFDLLFKIF